MRAKWAILIVAGLTACSGKIGPSHNSAFDLPADFYNMPDYDDEERSILHPAGYLSRLNTKPETECDREALRKLVISLNMYSYDMMQQSFFMETSSPGAKILLGAFPSLNAKTDESGKVINIDAMSDHLRSVEILCAKN